jgi:hypothetical protein
VSGGRNPCSDQNDWHKSQHPKQWVVSDFPEQRVHGIGRLLV